MPLSTRKPFKSKLGNTYWATPEQRKFKAKYVKLTGDVKVYGLLPCLLKTGTILRVAPLISDFHGSALDELGDVSVLLSGSLKGGNSTCWIPDGKWEISKRA